MLSHTATSEWQSFEMRMRRRRAERLALRAEAAASAGFEDDARACLAEARTLAPDLPQLAAAEAALVRQPEPLFAVAAAAPPPRSAFIAGAAACTLLAAFIGGWFAYRDVPEADVLPAQVEAAATPPAPINAAETREVATNPAPTTAVTAPAPPIPAPRTAPEPASVSSEPPPSRAEALVSREAPPPAPAPLTAPSVGTREGLPALPDGVLAAAPAAPLVRVEAPPVATTTAPAAGVTGTVLPPPSVDVKAPVVEAAQEPLVMAVLNRFASAYSALDAEAAERVWPTVNRGALERAFDGLARQRVSLGECRLDVTGTKARARCVGSATWSPKVGSGTHTETRVWTFDLARVGAGWQILNARAQNK